MFVQSTLTFSDFSFYFSGKCCQNALFQKNLGCIYHYTLSYSSGKLSLPCLYLQQILSQAFWTITDKMQLRYGPVVPSSTLGKTIGFLRGPRNTNMAVITLLNLHCKLWGSFMWDRDLLHCHKPYFRLCPEYVSYVPKLWCFVLQAIDLYKILLSWLPFQPLCTRNGHSICLVGHYYYLTHVV